MRILALLGNIIFIGSMICMVSMADNIDVEGILGLLLMLIVPIINILALTISSNDFISLYFKRNRLEQEKKIRILEEELAKSE